MTVAEDREQDLDRLLITREEAAKRCGVGLNKLDEWTWEPGFPVIRERGHFVRIHSGQLDAWLAARALMTNRAQSYRPVRSTKRSRSRKRA
jgi:hypothetical protein